MRSNIPLPMLLRILIILAALASPLSAQLSVSYEGKLKRSFEGKSLLIRHFYQGGRLEYDDKARIKHGREGVWTVDGFVAVESVRIEKGILKIKGQRLVVLFDLLDQHATLRPYRKAVTITVPIASEAETTYNLQEIFISSSEDLGDSVPAIWVPFVEFHAIGGFEPKHKNIGLSAGIGAKDVGGRMKAPAPLGQPKPIQNEFVKQFGISGVSQFTCVVDEKGIVKAVWVSRPKGAGLDDAAAEAIMGWKFSPATEEGVPTKVLITVDFEKVAPLQIL